MIELLASGLGWLLGYAWAHPGWSLGLASWAVAVALVLLGSLALARGVLLTGGALAAVLAGTLAWRMLGDVAGGARKGRGWRGRHSPLYVRHVRQQSPAWRRLRAGVLGRAGGRCESCGAPGPLAVHHLTYERLGRERLGDLRALCARCHTRAHRGRILGFRGKKTPPAKRGGGR